MNEIENKIGGICQDCIHLNKIMPIIEQLQQENEDLKEQYSKLEEKYFNNIPCCNEDDCGLYKEYLNDKNILTEFEKWLEEKTKCTEQYADNDMAKGYINAIKLCKCYLKELKEGKK